MNDETPRPLAGAVFFLRKTFQQLLEANREADLLEISWHHTSKHFNRTDFYRPNEQGLFWLEQRGSAVASTELTAAIAEFWHDLARYGGSRPVEWQANARPDHFDWKLEGQRRRQNTNPNSPYYGQFDEFFATLDARFS